MLNTENIHSLTDFLRNHKDFVKKIEDSKEAEVLTINGKAKLVVMHHSVFQDMSDKLNKLAELERLEAIQAGINAGDRGETIGSKEARKAIKKRNGI